MKILVTGAAGFIGFCLIEELLNRENIEVVGIDNISDYYDVDLKYSRLAESGIIRNNIRDCNDGIYSTQSTKYKNYKFLKIDITNNSLLEELFRRENFNVVVNLAAQAGVRYSLINPRAYINTNIDGFFNILENSKNYNVEHLVYASSSSVYGLNSDVPYSEKSGIAHPVSLYAASKKANELLAHSYSHLYNIPTTGLRFFTVYGPWGRPDMSPYLFTKAIMDDETLNLFNEGDMIRDFTYIDDIIDGVVRVINNIPKSNNDNWNSEGHDPSFSSAPYKIYNIGNSSPVQLMDFLNAIELACDKQAKIDLKPMQPGDVYQTNADTNLLRCDLGYKPKTSIIEGVKKYVDWFKYYYKK